MILVNEADLTPMSVLPTEHPYERLIMVPRLNPSVYTNGWWEPTRGWTDGHGCKVDPDRYVGYFRLEVRLATPD